MAEHKCVVNYCCCGCSLKSGSLAIGIFVLVVTLLQAIYNIFLAIKYGTATEWVAFIICLFVVVMACILIQGIRQERRGYIMAWVVTMVVILVIELILAIILLIGFYLAQGIGMLIGIGIYIYLVIVVRSYALTIGSSAGMA